MKNTFHITALSLGFASSLCAQSSLKDDLAKQNNTEPQLSVADANHKHSDGAKKVAGEQDELSADVQDLIQEQTDGNVIKLLEEAEKLMAEATDNLEIRKTGGETIAIETEIIERIFEAAKKKQQSSSSSPNSQKNMGAMLEMMERMMGKKPGDQPGEKPGEQAGEGSEGDSDKANEFDSDSNNEGNSTTRRIPKSAGTAGSALPRELQKALDAFNKASAEK